MPALTETAAPEVICHPGASVFHAGLTFGLSGNLSIRLPSGG